jgi:hypothetical protein
MIKPYSRLAGWELLYPSPPATPSPFGARLTPLNLRSKVNTLKPRCARKEKQISLWLKENQSHAFRFPFDVLFLLSV